MKGTKTKKLVISALFAALACAATIVIHIPIAATNGYINLGDCIVLLSGFMLGPVYGFAAAGIGSALADLILGYASYAPATFVIKGLMALIAALIYRFPEKNTFKLILAGIASELIMIFGYYLYESIWYGFAGAAPAIVSNAIQGAAGLIAAVILIKVFANIKNIRDLF